MLPTAVPAAARYAHGRVAAGLLFALSYLVVWGFAGVAVFVLCGPHGALAPGTTTIAAGIYELTPLKRYFRRRCRDSAASGLDAGFDCVGSCLGLMLAAMALGVTGAAGMSVVALLVAAQKLLPVKATVDVPLAAGDRRARAPRRDRTILRPRAHRSADLTPRKGGPP